MKGARRLLIALGGAVLVLALLAGAVVWSGRSLVIIDNRGDAALTVEVSATRTGDFAWSGELKGGQRLFRLATFRGDGAVRAVCRDGEGVYRATGGQVSAGRPHRVDVVISGCAAMRIDADRLP